MSSFDGKEIQKIKKAREKFDESKPPPSGEHKTSSGIPVERVYSPAEIDKSDYLSDIGFPGEYPYTRGTFANGYLSRVWNKRQVAGYGTAEEANQRFKYLIAQGQTAFYVPHVQRSGIGSEDEQMEGFLGLSQPHFDTLADWEDVLKGIDLNKYSISLGTDSAVALAMYITAAEKMGYNRSNLKGSMSNKVRMILYPENKGNPFIDIVEFSVKEMPFFNCFYVDGRNPRDGGLNAVYEAGWTLAAAIDGIRACIERGINVDEFGPRTSFFLSVENDFFEEIAKLRAMRRMWARIMREKFDAKDPRSWRFRFHIQDSSVSYTAQQPLNNLTRGAIHGLAAVLGGCQSMHINSFDEAIRTPSEFSATVSLRTQQILEHETGITNVVDPLGGSYYVEWLTDKLEEEAQKVIDKIEGMGGASKAAPWILEQQRMMAYKHQQEIQNKERMMVGVNVFQADNDEQRQMFSSTIQKYNRTLRDKQIARLNKVKKERDNDAVEQAKKMLYEAYKAKVNIVPPMIEAVKTYISESEITEVRVAALGERYGTKHENVVEMTLFIYM